MKRNIFSIVALAVFCFMVSGLALSGCDNAVGNNAVNNNDPKPEGQKTSIRIKNETYSWLMNVHLGDKYFEPTVENPYGREGLPGDPGYFSVGDVSFKVYLTEDISGYIYFIMHINTPQGASGTHPCRTRELVVVNQGEELEFVFTDNTLIVDSNDSSNIRTLKDMEAYIIEQLDA
jgi:hypothetical protein